MKLLTEKEVVKMIDKMTIVSIKFFGDVRRRRILYLVKNIRDVIQIVKIISAVLIVSREVRGKMVFGRE